MSCDMRAIDRALLVACAVTLSACTIGDPYRFGMHRFSEWPIDGRIEGDYHVVDIETPNVVKVDDGARVALRVKRLTDGTFNTEAVLHGGGEATFYLRTSPYDRREQRDDGIVLTVRQTHSTLTMETGASVTMPTPFTDGRPSEIQISNDGRFIDVTVACTRIARLPTTLPSTEWVIVQPGPGSSVELIDPKFRPLYDTD